MSYDLLIGTITLNTAIDKSYSLEEININEVNRVRSITYGAGGKDINCTKVIKVLGGVVYGTNSKHKIHAGGS